MFLEVHVPLELGFTVCVFAAIIYSLRLIGKDRARVPRWVMMLNLVFGPLLLSCLVVGGIIAHIGE